MPTAIAYEKTLTSNITFSRNYTLRTVIPAAQLTAPSGTPTFARLTLHAGAVARTVTAAFIGHMTSSYAFTATPVPVTVGGLSTFTIPANSSVVTDDLPFAWNKSSGILVSAYEAGSGDGQIRMLSSGIAGGSLYFKAGNDASVVSPTGYTASSYMSSAALVGKIEMDGFEEGEEEPPVEPPPAPTGTDFEVMGVIRNTGSGWFVINDAGHEPVNIASISTGSSYVQINYGKTASKVRTLIVAPDDTFAQAGYSAGASVNLDNARIYFGLNGFAVSPSSVVSSAGNFWIYGKMKG